MYGMALCPFFFKKIRHKQWRGGDCYEGTITNILVHGLKTTISNRTWIYKNTFMPRPKYECFMHNEYFAYVQGVSPDFIKTHVRQSILRAIIY
jgi:hypothetical protein